MFPFSPYIWPLRGHQKRIYFLFADVRDLVTGRPDFGFLAFLGLLAVFFLATAVAFTAAFLTRVCWTLIPRVFFFCIPFFLGGLGSFLLTLKKPDAAPVPLTGTKSFWATSRLRAVMILVLSVSTAYPLTFRAFFRDASDTPAFASATDAAFMMRSDTDAPAAPGCEAALLLVATEGIANVSASDRGRCLRCPSPATGSYKATVRTV